MAGSDSRFVPPFTEQQTKAFAQLIPNVFVAPSWIGLACILWHALSHLRRRGRSYHRIVAVMSLYDVLFALKNVFIDLAHSH